MISGKLSTASPELISLLIKHGLTWELFSKKGRPPPGVRERRSAVVTDLHRAGTTWADMQRITGLSVGAINRLTKAVGNPASRKNRAENAVRVGRKGKGRSKPWLSDKLRNDWEAGKFDFHMGGRRWNYTDRGEG